MGTRQLNAAIFLHLAFALTVSASLQIVGSNATVQVEKIKTSVLQRYSLGAEFQMKRSIEGIKISCELSTTNAAELVNPKIDLLKLGDSSSSPNVTSEISVDRKTFRAKVTMAKFEEAVLTSAYICQGEDSGQKVNTTIAFLSVPLLTLSVEGVGYETVENRQAYATTGDLPATHDRRISITCEVHGYPTAAAEWHRIELIDEQLQELPVGKGNKLEFIKVDYYRDRGRYVCRAENNRGKNSLNIFLRVKHPRAYLVPLIILVIQVVIVTAIYIVYELRVYEKHWRAARHLAQEEQLQADISARFSTLSTSAGARSSTLSTSAGARFSTLSTSAGARFSTLSTSSGVRRKAISSATGTRTSAQSVNSTEVAGGSKTGASSAPGPSAAAKALPSSSVGV